MEDNRVADWMYAKRVWKDFEIRKLGNIMICILKLLNYF